MPKCVVCLNEQERAVCDYCERITGVREMPPARRRTIPCVRCNHPRLIRVVPRELSVDGESTQFEPVRMDVLHGPMFATYDLTRQKTNAFHKPTTYAVSPPQPRDGRGVFEAYICRQCGFVDWYCQDPDSIPVGPEYMTEDVELASSGDPYR